MTVAETIRRTRLVIGAAVVVRAISWGITATYGILAIASFAWLVIPALSGRRELFQAIALLSGVIVIAILVWRARHFTVPTQLALWMEERVPGLDYALVTALESRNSPFVDGMERRVAELRIPSRAVEAIHRPVSLAIAAAALAIALLYLSPTMEFSHSGRYPWAVSFTARRGAFAGSRLENIEARVVPPAYTRARASTIADPSSIEALVGSSVTISGRGSGPGISAKLQSPLDVSNAGDGWRITIAMPAKPTALTLRDRTFRRVIVLAPRADTPPSITLSSPQHDTALRAPKLIVQLVAAAVDDIGLDQGHFEYLITSGSGEIFTARTIATPVLKFGNARSGSLTATLDLASLKLSEGDVVSMRAVAQDGNTLTGPGVATSDTRTIRIVRASEYDSLSIEAAAPPPLDSSAVSQRMLIGMAEQLVKEKPRLARTELVRRSTDIGELEDRIRRRVRDILSDGEESPPEQLPDSSAPTVMEMEAPDEINGTKNPDLKAAYNALWEAVRALKIAEPATALPPMRVALKALDRARLLNRLYLRGTPPRIIVDLNRVRLSGKEKGSSSVRSPRPFADSARSMLSARFDAMVALIETNPARAVSEMALLRVDALSALPGFAAALGDATDAIRKGKDATLPLLRARRALTGPPRVTPALSPWSRGGSE